MTDPEFVAACFEAILKRAPSGPEALHFCDQLKRGTKPAELLEQFFSSEEFRMRSSHGDVEFVPGGHFYSAVPSLADRRHHAAHIAELQKRTSLPGITISETLTFEHIDSMAKASAQADPWLGPRSDRRYRFDNSTYSYGDALSLLGTLQRVGPARVIEVGSGYSSALLLDANDHLLNSSLSITFIEPYPELLNTLARTDQDSFELIARPVQSVSLDVFRQLKANDILFIDSTHVVKMASDVHFLYLEVLPVLVPGVYIHIHDIFWPFEYPPAWIEQGRAWNEAYFLRALLTDNPAYEIVYFSDYARLFHEERLAAKVPLAARNYGGHIWLRTRSAHA